MNEYKYIIIQFDTDYYRICYNDLISNDNIVYRPFFYKPSNKFIGRLYRLHHSKEVNRRVLLPLKRVWYRAYVNSFNLNKNDVVCFVIDARYMMYDYYRSFLEYLKKHYINCKIVMFYQDRVSTYHDYLTRELISPDKLIYADFFISYSRKDSDDYKMLYHPTVMSKISVPESDISNFDVYFCGQAKGRLNAIVNLYDELTKNGCKCFFNVTGVPENEIVMRDGIRYNVRLKYLRNLQYISHSKCIVELMAGEADGCTLRTWEAFLYDKVLITNNAFLKQTSFNLEKVCFIDECNLDIKDAQRKMGLKMQFDPAAVSPLRLIDFIGNILKK